MNRIEISGSLNLTSLFPLNFHQQNIILYVEMRTDCLTASSFRHAFKSIRLINGNEKFVKICEVDCSVTLSEIRLSKPSTQNHHTCTTRHPFCWATSPEIEAENISFSY